VEARLLPELSFIDAYRCCPLCVGAHFAPDFSVEVEGCKLQWVRCQDCELVFQNPRLTEDSLTHLYRSTNYFGLKNTDGDGAYSDYTKADPIRIAQGRRRISRISKLSGIAKGQLLDVGSASGSFALAARSAGFDVTCI